MEYILIIGQLILGIIFTLIGFKLYDPFKGKSTPEIVDKWYSKFGRLMKILGVILIIISSLQLLFHSEKDSNIWTEGYKDGMTESCFQTAKKQVSDPNIAREYCECTTEKITSQLTKTQFDSIQKLTKKDQLGIYNPLIESCQ